MRFSIENYPGDVCMHCKTEWEAVKFLEYLHSIGKTWITGGSYVTSPNRWDDYKEDTCYDFNPGQYCDIGYFVEEGFEILEFDAFDWSGCDMASIEFDDSVFADLMGGE